MSPVTVAEANAVNALLRYVFDLPDPEFDGPGSEAVRADRARSAAMLLAGRAHRRLGAGIRPVDIALACSRQGWPSHDGGALLALVDPDELPCACPDTHRLSGDTVGYCPRHHWPDMASWIADAGFVLVRTDHTRDGDV